MGGSTGWLLQLFSLDECVCVHISLSCVLLTLWYMFAEGGTAWPFCLIILLVIEPGSIRVPSVLSLTESLPHHGGEENQMDFGQHVVFTAVDGHGTFCTVSSAAALRKQVCLDGSFCLVGLDRCHKWVALMGGEC